MACINGECDKWEDTGLLHTAQELAQKEEADFIAHCAECVACARRVEEYRRDKTRLFSPEILGAKPSARVDLAIAQAAANPVRITALHLNLFSGVKKAVVPLLLFVLGFGTGTYFVLNVYNAKNNAAVASSVNLPAPATAVVLQDSLPVFQKAADDSLAAPIEKPFTSPRTNAVQQILPVRQ